MVGIIGNGRGSGHVNLGRGGLRRRENLRGDHQTANFLEHIGGGASAEVMEAGFRIIMDDPDVEAIFRETCSVESFLRRE